MVVSHVQMSPPKKEEWTVADGIWRGDGGITLMGSSKVPVDTGQMELGG